VPAGQALATNAAAAPPTTTGVSPSSGLQRQYKPSAASIILGVLFLMAALWWWNSTGDATFAPLGRALFATLLGLGFLLVVTGILQAPLAVGYCSTCARQTVLKRSSLSWTCGECKRTIALEPLGFVSLIIGVIVVVFLVQAAIATMASVQDDGARGIVSSTTTREQTLVDKQVSIDEDEYHMITFTLNRDAHISVSIDAIAGPEFEVWTMPEEGFRAWEKAARSFLGGGEYSYLPGLSESKIHRMERSGMLSAGRYYVIIDNSDMGNVSPPANFVNDKLTVRVKIVIRG
jgi:hypothetical protein